jgi:hypothetical protein
MINGAVGSLIVVLGLKELVESRLSDFNRLSVVLVKLVLGDFLELQCSSLKGEVDVHRLNM